MQMSDRIFEIFAAKGGDAYFGEPVTQLDHALQRRFVGADGGEHGWHTRPDLFD